MRLPARNYDIALQQAAEMQGLMFAPDPARVIGQFYRRQYRRKCRWNAYAKEWGYKAPRTRT
ncbi:MAG: hypothetical protein IPP63_14790 [Chloracidobacterium sp.]|nr:hypothetical protein [Chloracidobacterium sp.]